MNGIKFFLTIVLMVSAGFAYSKGKPKAKPIDIVVHRSPSCGCCEKWVEHLKQNNFKVEDIVSTDVQAVKDKYGVSKELASCHTALVNGYVIEGHVSSADIHKLLQKKPDVVGLTVPKMPSGTPGMEMGGRKDPYQVFTFDKKNQQQVFSDYQAK